MKNKINKKAIVAAVVIAMIPALATACPSHQPVRHVSRPIHRVVLPPLVRHIHHVNRPTVVYRHEEYVPLPEDRYVDYSESYSESNSYSDFEVTNVVTDDTCKRSSCNNGEFQQGEAPRQDKIEYEYFCVNGVWYHARVWHHR